MDKKTYLQWDHLISSNAELIVCAILLATTCLATGMASLLAGIAFAVVLACHVTEYSKRKNALKTMDALPDLDDADQKEQPVP